ADALQQRGDYRARRRVGELPGARVEDDLVRVARLRGETALQQVERMLRVRAREREVLRRPRADRLGCRQKTDADNEPGQDDDASMRDRPASQLQHHRAIVARTSAGRIPRSLSLSALM